MHCETMIEAGDRIIDTGRVAVNIGKHGFLFRFMDLWGFDASPRRSGFGTQSKMPFFCGQLVLGGQCTVHRIGPKLGPKLGPELGPKYRGAEALFEVIAKPIKKNSKRCWHRIPIRRLLLFIGLFTGFAMSWSSSF